MTRCRSRANVSTTANLDRGGGGIGAARRARRRDDVTDIFHDEQIARLALRDEFRSARANPSR